MINDTKQGDDRMKDSDKQAGKPLAQKIWVVFGVLVILFSMIFMLPSIYLSLTGNNRLGAYVNEVFIPFLFSLLLVFIVLVVVYIWWHMSNQTDLIRRLERIEDKLDLFSNNTKTES
jgi:sterol desaturase/sphingolipid hydroxylase (fatty acid hydroxylase superfamily)